MSEVLRTLQDLVQNELVVEPAKPDATADTSAQSRTAEPQAVTVSDASPAGETPATVSLPDLAAVSPVNPVPVPVIPPGGLQTELPYLEDPSPESETASPEPAASLPPDPDALLREPDAGVAEMPDLTAEAVANTAPAADTGDPSITHDSEPLAFNTAAEVAPPSPREAGLPGVDSELPDLGDFPVLEDAVELSHEPGQAGELPSATDARRLAIQVAARLNVELRREGQAGLSSDIIARLAHMLEEALAKAAANMENTGPDHH